MTSKKIGFTLVFTFLLAASAFAQSKNIILNGLEVVPDVQTPATGSGTAWVESDTLYVQFNFKNLQAPYFAANIHYGEEGENGNPIYMLKPDLSEDHTSGSFKPEENKFLLSDAMKEAFNKGNLYITVASDQHQRGEIRGQIDRY